MAIAIVANSSALAAFLEEVSATYEEPTDLTPLSQAAVDNDTEMIQQLISDGVDLEEKDSEGLTALQQAVSYENLETPEMLLENGADSSLKDSEGNTLFDF